MLYAIVTGANHEILGDINDSFIKPDKVQRVFI